MSAAFVQTTGRGWEVHLEYEHVPLVQVFDYRTGEPTHIEIVSGTPCRDNYPAGSIISTDTQDAIERLARAALERYHAEEAMAREAA